MRMFDVYGEISAIVQTQIAGNDRLDVDRKANDIFEFLGTRFRELSSHMEIETNCRVGVVKEVKKGGINVTVEKRTIERRLKKIVKVNKLSFEDLVKTLSRRIKTDLMMALLIFREGTMNAGGEISLEKGFKNAGTYTKKVQYLEFVDLFGTISAHTRDIKIEEDVIFGGVKFVLTETVTLMLKTVNRLS